MANVRTCLWSVIAIVVVASSAYSQGQPPMQDPETMFQQLDANKDGKLTLGEGGPGSQQMLRRLFEMAKKKDGESISRDEFRRIAEQHRRGPGGGGPGNPPPRPMPSSPSGNEPMPAPNESRQGDQLSGLLRLLDENRDGKLSRAELSRLTERFNDWDRNRDGQLDADELRAINSDSQERRVGADAPMNDPSRRPMAQTPASRESTSGSAERNGGRRPTNATASTGPTNAALQNRLAGTWRGWVVDGRGENPNAGHMEMELRVEGNRMFGREVGSNRAPEGLGDGTFVVTGSGNSGVLDAVQATGQHAGRSYPGIFEIDGDTLKWCVNNRNGARPTTFESGRGNYFMILRRQAK